MLKLKRTKAYFKLADRLIVERAKGHSPNCFSRNLGFGPEECDCGTPQARKIVPRSEWERPDTGPR
jgi:hypothetical protein